MMDWINQQGLKGILAVQRLPPLGGLLRLAGILGDDLFIMMVVAASYWGLNPAFGAHLGVVLGLATAVNHLLKLAFRGPRPYWLDFRVRALSKSPDYGLPSRHVQNAVLTLGVVLGYIPSNWWLVVLIIGLVLVALVALSRMYVGVHFPGDVVAGFVLGAAGWALDAALAASLAGWWAGLGVGLQIGISFLVSLVYLGVTGLILKVTAAIPDPPSWAQIVNEVTGGSTHAPRDATYQFATAGSLFGLGTALAMASVWLVLGGAGGGALAVRMVVGVLGLAALWFGAELVHFKKGSWSLYIFNYIQHTLLLMWLFLLAPLVFAAFHF